MIIKRTIPPAAAPLGMNQLLHGFAGLFNSRSALNKRKAELQEYFNIKHVFLFSSGKAALATALNTLKCIAPGKKQVVIPAYTCYSVPSAIIKSGLKVSLCDIDTATFDFDYEKLEKIISANTLCIIPTHLFGIPSDMDRIMKLRNKKDFFILEDAAQSLGCAIDEKRIGTIGDLGLFSFGRGKNIACGTGGLIITNSDAIAGALEQEYADLKEPSKIECLLEYLKTVALALFIHPDLYWLPSVLPFLKLGETFFHKDFPVARLSGMHAALLRGWSERLEQSNLVRSRNAVFFQEALDLEFPKKREINYLRLPFLANDNKSRDEIFSLSISKGLGIGKMYPVPINEIEELKNGFAGLSYPSAKWLSGRLLTLPTHHLLTDKDKENIVTVLSIPRYRRSGTLQTAKAAN
jgi:dTDP-4-amino-4,6-dideoxygalactose transaminase